MQRHRRSLLFVIALAAIAGALTALRLPISLFPNVSFPRAVVSLDAGSGFHLVPAPTPQDSVLPRLDPSIRMAVCRYDLDQGPVHVRAPVTPAFLKEYEVRQPTRGMFKPVRSSL